MMRDDLSTLIADAARKSFSELFDTHHEDFYYCTLITTGEGLPPAPSAWSWQALERAVSASVDPEQARAWLKWSYSESPYWLFGEAHFAPVAERFSGLPDPHDLKDPAAFDREVQRRLVAMEDAMKMLDAEGLFGRGDRRDKMVVLVEVMPPDSGNTERALRLNPPGPALDMWLNEAAEE